MDKNINKIIKTYIKLVMSQQPDLLNAYLFGSYAKNKQRTESDIDIALVFGNLSDKDRFNTQVKLMLLAANIDSRIEPHPLSKQDFQSDNPFITEILKTGKKLPIK